MTHAAGGNRPPKKTLWARLPLKLGRELARDRGLRVSKAPADLCSTYGDPPPLSFVIETWPVLVSEWLSLRPEPRERLARALQHSDSKQSGANLESRAGQLRYLSSCTLDEDAASAVLYELNSFASLHYDTIYPPDWDPAHPEPSRVGRLRKDRSVTMRVDRRVDLVSYLDAKVNRDGDLVLEGQDIGEHVERMLGSDEYEYVTTYRRADLPMVLEALGEEPGTDMMEAIVARWCGTAESFEFERRLTEADIPHERWSHA